MIETAFPIVLLILVAVIAFIIYCQYKLPNKIKYISCYTQTKEIEANSNSFIFLFNFVNETHVNIEKIDIVLIFNSTSIIYDFKFYDRNIALKKIDKNELHLIIQNFNRGEKKAFKVFINNSVDRSFYFISDTTGIKIRQIVLKKLFIDFPKILRLIISPFQKISDPLLNTKTIKREKRNYIAIVMVFIALISLSCFVLTNYKTMHQNYIEIFRKDKSDTIPRVGLPAK